MPRPRPRPSVRCDRCFPSDCSTGDLVRNVMGGGGNKDEDKGSGLDVGNLMEKVAGGGGDDDEKKGESGDLRGPITSFDCPFCLSVSLTC